VWGYLYAQSRGSVPKFRTVRVERGPLTAAVSATGNLNAVITVQVGSQVSGQIKDLLVDFNSIVKKNQVIARIDPDIFTAKVNQAKADVESAKATVLNQEAQVERARADVENARAAYAESKAQTAKAQVAVVDAKRDFDRKTELFARRLIARSDLDSSQAAHDSALAQVDSAKAHEQALDSAIQSATAQLRVAQAMLVSARAGVDQKTAGLKQAQVDLDHTTILAPVDGVVVSRQVDVGQTVAASLQAPILFTIAQDLTKMQVETSVDEADIGRLKLDDRANFTVDAFPGRDVHGHRDPDPQGAPGGPERRDLHGHRGRRESLGQADARDDGQREARRRPEGQRPQDSERRAPVPSGGRRRADTGRAGGGRRTGDRGWRRSEWCAALGRTNP
jgi:HlyD family secretion protein